MNKNFLLFIMGSVCLFGWYNLKTTDTTDGISGDLLIENIEALSEIEEIGGKVYIVDRIPCASAGNEILIHESYVNCTDCKSQHGKSTGLPGECTNVRLL